MKHLIIAAALVFASCRQCNAALFIPRLVFELPRAEAAQFSAGESTVRTCINQECWDAPTQRMRWDPDTRLLSVDQWRPVDGGTNGETMSVPAGPTNDVSLTVLRDGNTLFTREWNDVTFDESEPNGPGCGVQYSTGVLTF